MSLKTPIESGSPVMDVNVPKFDGATIATSGMVVDVLSKFDGASSPHKSPVEMDETRIPEFENSSDSSKLKTTAATVQYPDVPAADQKNPDVAPVQTSNITAHFIPFEKLNNVCFPFQNQGYCLRGDNCKFDHYPPELCPCIEWSQYNCSRGMGCRFAHLEPRPRVPQALVTKLKRTNTGSDTRKKMTGARMVHNHNHNHRRPTHFNHHHHLHQSRPTRVYNGNKNQQYHRPTTTTNGSNRYKNTNLARNNRPTHYSPHQQFHNGWKSPNNARKNASFRPTTAMSPYRQSPSPSAFNSPTHSAALKSAVRRRSLEMMERDILAREADFYKRQYYDTIRKISLNPNASEFKTKQ